MLKILILNIVKEISQQRHVYCQFSIKNGVVSTLQEYVCWFDVEPVIWAGLPG